MRRDLALGQEVGDRRVTPEQRRGQRRAAIAVRAEIGARAGLEQQAREREVVAVAGLVQRRPAAVVGAARVGSAREQLAHERLIAPPAGQLVASPSRSLPFVPRAETSPG